MTDLSLVAIDYRAPGADAAFTQSLRSTGFGVLKNHPMDAALVARIYAQWAEFFAGADKNAFVYDKATQAGFFPSDVSEAAKGQDLRDIKEYFHFYPWGPCPEPLRADLAAYYAGAETLAAELLSWVEAHSPAEVAARYSQSLSSMIVDSPKTLLRILHYPRFTGSEEPGAIRAAAHEDINLLTLLPAASAPGLQVLARDGSWLEVPCDFGNLIVNVGDMLQEASGDWFPSTTHRVVNPPAGKQDEARMSLPLFLHPWSDVVLSERYTAGAYLDERLRELGVV